MRCVVYGRHEVNNQFENAGFIVRRTVDLALVDVLSLPLGLQCFQKFIDESVEFLQVARALWNIQVFDLRDRGLHKRHEGNIQFVLGH